MLDQHKPLPVDRPGEWMKTHATLTTAARESARRAVDKSVLWPRNWRPYEYSGRVLTASSLPISRCASHSGSGACALPRRYQRLSKIPAVV